MFYGELGHDFKEIYAFTYPTVFSYLDSKIKGKNIADFFVKHNINSIAICIRGVLNNLGELFYKDIANSEIDVKYFIDKSYYNIFSGGISGKPVIGLDELQNREPVDAYIVAPIYYFNEIADDLVSAGIEIDKIISLTDVIFDM